MDLDKYQREAVKTAIYPDEYEILYPLIGLAGEAGEMLNKFKKVLRDNTPVDDTFKNTLIKELGDVLWYVALTAEDIGYNLDEVANLNLAKLQSRQERGVLGGSGDNR